MVWIIFFRYLAEPRTLLAEPLGSAEPRLKITGLDRWILFLYLPTMCYKLRFCLSVTWHFIMPEIWITFSIWKISIFLFSNFSPCPNFTCRSVVETFSVENDLIVEKLRRKCFKNVGSDDRPDFAEGVLQKFSFRSRSLWIFAKKLIANK